MNFDILQAGNPPRQDITSEKRVELHLHTCFSMRDSCATPSDLIKQAAQWGHRAIAITDHGGVQAFPEAFAAAKNVGIKLIPGCEGYMINDGAEIVERGEAVNLDSAAYVVLDVETTGLNTHTDKIIAIGAVRIKNGVEDAEFSELIDPGRRVPEHTAQITGITSSMVRGKPKLTDVMPAFADFCKNAVLVAHCAPFAIAFIRRAFRAAGLPFHYPVLDTMTLVRRQYPALKKYKAAYRTASVCQHLGISLSDEHNVMCKARTTGRILLRALADLRSQNHISMLSEINTCYPTDASNRAYHITMLACTQKGMENLYRLVSEGHLNYYNRVPHIPRGLIRKYREGLLIGSACKDGELFRAILEGSDDDTIQKIAAFYDYLEIQPIGNNKFLKRNGTFLDDEELRNINRKIVQIGEMLNKPVCATGDAHFKEPGDAIYREILKKNADQPPLYLKTTDEMLDEFSYLGEEKAKEIVITNPNRITDRVGDVRVFCPHPEGKRTFLPCLPGAEEELQGLVTEKAKDIYGSALPELVQERMDRELSAIIGNDFSTLYLITAKLAARLRSEGNIVSYRGLVGASFVMFLLGVTEINPLPPHYVCPKCKHFEADASAKYGSGMDLPLRPCPGCGAEMRRDGFGLPAEVFQGADGRKLPNIVLTLSSNCLSKAIEFINELLGGEVCYHAGAINKMVVPSLSILYSPAHNCIRRYATERKLTLNTAEELQLAAGLRDAVSTVHMHATRLIILPRAYSVYQFTPLQHPVSFISVSQETVTHFDALAMIDALISLDVMEVRPLVMLRKLQDMTGVTIQKIPLNDKEVFNKVVSLFPGTEALGITAEQLGLSNTGTIGIPWVDRLFEKDILECVIPVSVEDLIRIAGLSQSTGAWQGNVSDLMKAGIPLKECISMREDIMNTLTALGVDHETAFKIMESVRKGKGLKPEMEKELLAHGAPSWYIDSCRKFRYLNSRAVAVADVMTVLRIAYFKVYYPDAFYICRLEDCIARLNGIYDTSALCTKNIDALREMIDVLHSKPERTYWENIVITMLEVLIEMRLRGISVDTEAIASF